MPTINGFLLGVSSSWVTWIVAKVTVAAALGLAGTWLARRSRAALRHTLMAATFGVLLVLPIASVVAPPIRVVVPAAAQKPIVPPSARAAVMTSPVTPTGPSAGVTYEGTRSVGFSLSSWLLAGWIAGTALFLMPVAIGLWQVRSLRRTASPWRHGQLVVDRLAFDTGIHRHIEVLVHGELPGPMTYGTVHPAIVLSEDAQSWEGDELNRAMVHELEHVRRGDWLSHCLARAVCAMYWFHPLVWIAWRRLELEAERSCDDAVLGSSEATAYAEQLVGIARRLSTAAKLPLLAMANRADLTARVRAVLDGRQRRGRAGALPVALACAVAVGLVLTVSPLTMVAAPQAASTAVSVSPMPLFSASAMLVTENVSVRDRDGKSIEGLSASDFEVTENGVVQSISTFDFQRLDDESAKKGTVSSYYTLGYYTTNPDMDGKFREVKIAKKNEAIAKLANRAGYYLPKLPNFGGLLEGVRYSIGDISFPALVYRKTAEYSDEARKAKYQGTSFLQVEIDASGEVANIQVTRSLGLGLDEKAIEAVKQWKFQPGYKDGKPVSMQARVEMHFRLL
jgi:TonB family protein